jgi:hypothetical protein
LPLQEQGYHSLVAVYAHNGDSCSGAKKIKQMGGWGFGGMDSESNQGMLKDPQKSYKPDHYIETAVSSGERFYFTIMGSQKVVGGSNKCYITSSFMPVQGAQYEVSYYTGATRCYMKIDHISKEKGSFLRTPESTTLQREKACDFFWN